MIDSRTEGNKVFTIFFIMKDTDCTMKIMESLITLDKLDGARTRRDFINRRETKETKHFTYR